MTHAANRPAPHRLPAQNPCAQCAAAIAAPEWVEEQEDRVSYLWHCKVCGYRFEASAFFPDSSADRSPLAA